jgi:hypothetical protein
MNFDELDDFDELIEKKDSLKVVGQVQVHIWSKWAVLNANDPIPEH